MLDGELAGRRRRRRSRGLYGLGSAESCRIIGRNPITGRPMCKCGNKFAKMRYCKR